MQSHPLFSRGNETVRDLSHVLVKRIVEQGAGGKSITFYRKHFKWAGWDTWSERENRFISLFHGLNLKHVVKLRAFSEDGTNQLSFVETKDAGLNLSEWMDVVPSYSNGTRLRHPFSHGEDFLRLMRACLVALQEIHEHDVVHCDIKQDNICLPCTPSYQPNTLLMPDFDALRLIDFSFSLGKIHPLTKPLGINPNDKDSIYLSPLLRSALNADLKNKNTEQTNKLDYRVDLYSLGYMFEQMMATESFNWDNEERGVSGKKLIKEVISDLKTFGSGKKPLRYGLGKGLPHPSMIVRLDEWLKDAKQQQTFIPVVGTGGRSVDRPAPRVTPVTPVITPPVVDISRNQNRAAPPPRPSKHDESSRTTPRKLLPLFFLASAILGTGYAWHVGQQYPHVETPPHINVLVPSSVLPAQTSVVVEPPAASPVVAVVIDPYIAARARIAPALTPTTAGDDSAFSAALRELLPFIRENNTDAKSLITQTISAWGEHLTSDRISIALRRVAYRRLKRLARSGRGLSTRSGNHQKNIKRKSSLNSRVSPLVMVTKKKENPITSSSVKFIYDLATQKIHAFENAWEAHQGRQTDVAHWLNWAQVLITEGSDDAQERVDALADALASGKDVTQNWGEAYLLYAALGDNATDQRKETLENNKAKLLAKIVKLRDTNAGSTVLPDVNQRAITGESGYAYYLGLINACALDKPDIAAAKVAYKMALQDQKEAVRKAARNALDAGATFCGQK